MRKLVTLLSVIFLFISPAVAQNGIPAPTTDSINAPRAKDAVLIQLRNRADSFLHTYQCLDASKKNGRCQNCPAAIVTGNVKKQTLQTVLPGSLATAYQPVFNTVILNNDNSINTGNAAAIIQDNNGGALSGNFIYQRKGIHRFQLFNIGLLAETNGSVWDLYTATAWRSGILATVGLTHLGRVSGQHIDPQVCEQLFNKRRLFLNGLLAQYKMKLATRMARKKRITEIENQLGVNDNDSSVMVMDQLERILNNPEPAGPLQQELDSLKTVQQQLDNLSGHLSNTGAYDSVLQQELTGFDKRNMPVLSGFRTWWYTLKLSVGNTRNKLYTDTFSVPGLPTYHLSDYARLKVSWDGNRLWSNKASLWLLKGEVVLYNRNYLQNKELSDLPVIKKDVTGKKYVYPLDNPVHYGKLGLLANLNTNIWVLNPNVYGAGFFMYDKCVGLEGSAGYKFNLNKFQDVPDPNTYTVYGGLIFRVKKEEMYSRATLSLAVGFFEAKKGRRAPDDFAFRLKVGIPFNTLPKKV